MKDQTGSSSPMQFSITMTEIGSLVISLGCLREGGINSVTVKNKEERLLCCSKFGNKRKCFTNNISESVLLPPSTLSHLAAALRNL